MLNLDETFLRKLLNCPDRNNKNNIKSLNQLLLSLKEHYCIILVEYYYYFLV